MINDPKDPQFEELRKLLALKRYERPPTEFRSEFMHAFRQNRIAEEARRRVWYRRLWFWLTPDWSGTIRSAAAFAVIALLIANAVVLPRQPNRRAPDIATTKPITTPVPPTQTLVSAVSTVAANEESSEDVSDETFLQAFLMMDDFYNETAKLFADSAERDDNAFAPEPRSRQDTSPMIPVSFSYPTM